MTEPMEGPPLKPPSRRRIVKRFGIAFLICASILMLDYFAYPALAPIGGPIADRAENGLWIRYTWYFGKKSDSEIDALAADLKNRRIKYVYAHVRFIRKDGSLRFRYPEHARRLIKRIHESAPDVKVIAWIYAGNTQGEGEVDLSKTEVRAKMVSEAKWLVSESGFDGVQWDYEICPNGDSGFVALMRETRAALPTGKILSAATALWLPWPVGGFGWSEKYFGEVARTCDQIVVMGYDSGFWLPRSYVWLMHQQVMRVTNAVLRVNPKCGVLIGVPTYGKGFLSHNPHAENIRMALKGVREGAADEKSARDTFRGVAIFADYTTQPEEWDTYERIWLGR